MSKAKGDSSPASATLHLTVTFEDHLVNALEAAKEIVEKAREQGWPEGFLEIHRADRIDVDAL